LSGDADKNKWLERSVGLWRRTTDFECGRNLKIRKSRLKLHFIHLLNLLNNLFLNTFPLNEAEKLAKSFVENIPQFTQSSKSTSSTKHTKNIQQNVFFYFLLYHRRSCNTFFVIFQSREQRWKKAGKSN
jgi:hypothetical protein